VAAQFQETENTPYPGSHLSFTDLKGKPVFYVKRDLSTHLRRKWTRPPAYGGVPLDRSHFFRSMQQASITRQALRVSPITLYHLTLPR